MPKRHEQAHDDEGRVDPVDTFLAQPTSSKSLDSMAPLSNENDYCD